MQHQNVDSIGQLSFGGKSVVVESYVHHEQIARRWWIKTQPMGGHGLLVRLSARKSQDGKARGLYAYFAGPSRRYQKIGRGV